MPTEAELVRLLVGPNESLTLEYKSWLDLTANHGKAVLAKAAIALANEGGGIIVLGMRAADNGPLTSQPRPRELNRFDQDTVNAAINRYADPEIHCELNFAVHPDSAVEHAFVIIPGGGVTPVMSTRDHQGEIMAQRCYVRKPGPRSEEPFTAEEWRGVLERCLQARRENMLDAIRLIVQGHASVAPPAQHDAFDGFCVQADRRWHQLVNLLPANDPARMPIGYYRISFEILEVQVVPTFLELRNRMDQARRIKHTGWGPFVSLTRLDLAPNIVDDAIEAWLGVPEAPRGDRSAEHCDFWRASRRGFFVLQRGYDEDSFENVEPGTLLDMTMPIWRVGEALLYASRLAHLFGNVPKIFFRVEYAGLRNRELGLLTRMGARRAGHVSDEDTLALEGQATAAEMDDNLVEVLHTLLAPLYERFSFFELTLDLVAREIEKMRNGRF